MKSFFILIHAGTCFKVWGKNTFFGGQGFCFYYMFKTTFSGQKKMWGGTKKLGGIVPECPPWLRACTHGLHECVLTVHRSPAFRASLPKSLLRRSRHFLQLQTVYFLRICPKVAASFLQRNTRTCEQLSASDRSRSSFLVALHMKQSSSSKAMELSSTNTLPRTLIASTLSPPKPLKNLRFERKQELP